jgi:hypothetical protein
MIRSLLGISRQLMLCMQAMLRVAMKAEVAVVTSSLLPQLQQPAFNLDCMAVQQLSSNAGLTPEHMLPIFLPVAAVLAIWRSECCNPCWLQLRVPGEAPKKPKVIEGVSDYCAKTTTSLGGSHHRII